MKTEIENNIKMLIEAAEIKIKPKTNSGKRYRDEDLIKIKALCFFIYKIYGRSSIYALTSVLKLDRTTVRYYHIRDVEEMYDYENDVLKFKSDFYKKLRGYILMFKSKMMNDYSKSVCDALINNYKMNGDELPILEWTRNVLKDTGNVLNVFILKDRLYAVIDSVHKDKCKELLLPYGINCLYA